MTITVPVPLTEEEQSVLLAQAEAQGVSVDSLLRKAVLQIIAAAPHGPSDQQLSPEDFEKAFEQMAEMVPESVPAIPGEALTRESIYTREDEW
jgi:hypothetical protein